MFNSVFSRRKVQRKIYNFTQSRRAQSPPSPASFASPDVHEKDSLHSNDHSFAFSDTSLNSKTGPSPQVQLNFENRGSISEWFPTELLRAESSTLSPPERNVSLPMGYTSHNASGSTSRFGGSSREALNFSRESIIIIEPERNPPPPTPEPEITVPEIHEPEPEPQPEPQPEPEQVREPSPPRRPAPTPIKIPQNPIPSKIAIQRSASAGASAGPRDQLPLGLHIPPRAPSRAESACSDEPSSTVSGTSLARALVQSSYIVSGETRNSRFRNGITRQDSATLPRGEHPFLTSPYWRDKQISGGEVIVSPEYDPDSPVPPVPPMPSSAELSGMSSGSGRMRRRSTSSITEGMSPQSEDLPTTPDAPPSFRHKRTTSLTRLPKEQLAMKRFSRISEASSPAPSPTTPGLNGSIGGSPKLERSSLVRSQSGASSLRENDSNVPISQPASHSSLRDGASIADTKKSSVGSQSDAELERALHDEAHSDDNSPVLPREDTPRSSSDHGTHSAPTSGDKRSFTVPLLRSPGSGSLAGSSAGESPGASFNVFRTRSTAGSSRNGGNPVTLRPIVFLPLGDRPHSVLVPQTASPLTAQTTSEELLRQKLPFRPRPSPAVPVTARFSTPSPMDSPDLLDFMFPVERTNIARQLSRNRIAGRQPAPITVPSTDEDTLSPDPVSSIDSPSSSSAVRQTFPETPYAFSPLVSAAFVPPLPTRKSPRTMKSLNRGTGKRSARTPLTSRQLMRSPSTGMGYGASVASRSSLSTSQPPAPLTPPHTADSTRSTNSDPGSTEMNPMRLGQAMGLATFGVGLLPSIEERSSAPSTPQSNLASPRSAGQLVSPLSQVFSGTSSPELVSVSRDASPRPPASRSVTSSPAPNEEPRPAVSRVSSKRVSPAPSSPTPFPSEPLPANAPLQDSSVPQKVFSSPNIQAQSTPPRSRRESPNLRDHAKVSKTLPSPPSPPVFITPFYSNSSESSRSVGSSRSSRRISSLDLSHSDHPVVPAKRALTPVPSPQPRHPLSSPPSPTSQIHSQADEIRSLIEDTPSEAGDPPLPPYHEQPVTPPGPLPPPYPTENTDTRSRRYPPGRPRPAPPSGPRRPSGPTLLQAANRARQGSVTSTTNSITGGITRAPSAPLSASLPKFHTTPIRFRGLTMEAAKWTFSSSQLQEIVSKAIKTSAEASAIRLLPIETFSEAVPEEMRRLEAQSSELRTNYKLSVRKRRGILNQLGSIVDGGDLPDQAAAIRLVQELKEVSDNLDHMSEELYGITDQLAQLRHLQDLHSTSALAMAVRKLNSSFVRHLAEKELLRQQVATLEAERDEAWNQAQEVAQEYDDLTDKVTSESVTSPAPPSSFRDASSRRSSRISIARKTSMRATKAGLRSPSRHRSSRSSVGSSLRGSMIASPPLTSAPGTGDIPPLPPIPRKVSLGIVTTDLPLRSAGIGSEITPTSEVRAMMEAQRELCEMLGIALEDLQGGSLSIPKRPRSASIGHHSNPASPRTRRNSDTFKPGRPLEMYGTVDDRAAILAAIGMVSHEI